MLSLISIEKAKSLILEGKSLRKISKELGVPYTSLNYAMRAENVSSEHNAFSRTNTLNEHFFNKIDSEEKAYWLGYLAADGSLVSQKNQKRINLSIKESDRNHLLKFKDALQLSWEPSIKRIFLKVTNKKYIAYRYIITSSIMYNDLIDKGLCEKKSLVLEPPRNVPDTLIKHWIRGYFDGDGSIFISERDQRFKISITGTKEVLTFIMNYVFNENDLPKLALFHDKRKNIAVYRLVIFNSLNKYKFLQAIIKDATIFLERKKALFDILADDYKR